MEAKLAKLVLYSKCTLDKGWYEQVYICAVKTIGLRTTWFTNEPMTRLIQEWNLPMHPFGRVVGGTDRSSTRFVQSSLEEEQIISHADTVIMATTPICLQRFYGSLYSCLFVYGSICLWMIATMLGYGYFLREHIRGAPYLDSQFFGLAGTAAIFAVTVALITARPTCECSVSCPSDVFFAVLYIVPAAELLVGIFCLVEAWKRRQLAQQVSNDVFTKVPDTEEEDDLELTQVDDEDEYENGTNDNSEDNHYIIGETAEDHVL
jgi:hypothetical protein